MGKLVLFGWAAGIVLIGSFDLLFRRVPNLLVVMVLTISILPLALNSASELSGALVVRPAQAIVGFVVGLAAFFPLWRLGVMGAGDVKFLAVIGLALGPIGLFSSWLVASVLAGVHALAAVGGRAIFRSAVGLWVSAQMRTATDAVRLAPAQAWIQARRGSRRGTPYATYLAIGALLWVFVLYDQYRY